MDKQQPSQVTPAGWHDDPQDPASLRYWDGIQWTANQAPKPAATAAAATPPPWTTGEQQPSQVTPAGWHDDPQDPASLRYWDGIQWTANQAPKPAATAAVANPSPWSSNRKIAAGGAAAVIVGSVMPWASVITAFGSITVNGTDGDGLITGIGGIIVLVLILTRKYLPALIVAGLTAAALVYDAVNISRAAGLSDNEYARASVGWGLYLAIAGAAVVIVTTILLINEKRNAKRPDAPTT